MKAEANRYVQKLQRKLTEAIELPAQGESFALLDFPNIRNVGDSAIWLGEMAHFSSRGVRPSYVSAMSDLDDEALAKAAPSGPIYLHGGGNFGDIWPGHQNFRERVLERWPDRKVIQLPQSIHFSSEEARNRAARAIEKHPDFTLLVRDRQSLSFATRHFQCKVVLCPDMAFAIGRVEPIGTPVMPILAMLRMDKERAGENLPDSVPVDDWITEPALPVKLAKAFGLARGAVTLDADRARLGKFNAAAAQRFRRGVRQLSRAELVITDRLHVHIISILMGRAHGVLDNSYGKIANFRAAFPEPEGLTNAFTNLDDALEWARGQATIEAAAAA